MRKVYLMFVGCLLLSCTVRAQDPQYSQFYAAPMYLNPAFAGTTDDSRAMFNHRIQWPKLDATFITSSFAFDHYFDRYNSGVGFIVTTDRISASELRSTDVGLQYS